MSAIMNGASLKEIQGRLEKEKAALKIAEGQVVEAREKVVFHNERIRRYKKELNELAEAGELIMSEHSMIKFSERVQVLHPDDIVKYVLTDRLKKMYETLGNGSYPLDDNQHSAIIKNNVVITII